MTGTDRKRSDVANNYIPKDYTDLYQYYILGDGHGNSLCHKIIRKILPHSDEDERETLAHDTFARLIEKDMLKVFDPTKANFGGVIFFVTRTICVNHLQRKMRNPITGLKGGSLVETDPESESFEPGVYSLDRLFQAEDPNNEGNIDNRAIIAELFNRARTLFEHPRHKRDESLYPLLNLLAQQNDPKECGSALGVTASTIHNWLGVLQKMVREIKDFLEDEQPEAAQLPRRRTHVGPSFMPFEDLD